MKNLKKRFQRFSPTFSLVVFLICILGILFVNKIGFAAFEWEVTLPPTPGGQTLSPTIDGLFLYIYNFALGLGAVMAFIRLTMAGIAWGSQSAGIGSKANAMETIKNTIFGLLLLLFSWVILNTINPQLVNPNASVLDKNGTEFGERNAPAQLTAAIKWSTKGGIGEALRRIGQYLIKVKPDVMEKLQYSFTLRKELICPTSNSSLNEICAKDCTMANFPCDYYQAKCSGKEPPNSVPGCPLPEDPRCADSAGNILSEAQFCMLFWDWYPEFENQSCGNYLSKQMDAALPGSGQNGYKEYIKEAGAYFGIDPRILAVLMTSESEELVPQLLTASMVEDFATAGRYIDVVRQSKKPGQEKTETWCDPNNVGATGHMSITIKSCNFSLATLPNVTPSPRPSGTPSLTERPIERCTWDTYCKFRGAANNVRNNDWSYKPNPSNILDGFAMAAKISRWIMDGSLKGGEDVPGGYLNDTLHYSWKFSPCPNSEELLKWEPPIINPIVFYAIGHIYYGDSISDIGLVPRYLDSSQLEIDVSSLSEWIGQNYEKIMKVRNTFALLLSNAGMGEFKPTESSRIPTLGDFLWWYFETHSSQ